MHRRQSGHVAFIHDSVMPASPEEVFPLLCPVREYEWIESWRCGLVYSESGVAEKGCVFTTDKDRHATWVVTRYEPPARIEFSVVADAGYVVRLKITVAGGGEGGSRLRWERIYTALNRKGERALARMNADEAEAHMVDLDKRLLHFLTTGEMLRGTGHHEHRGS